MEQKMITIPFDLELAKKIQNGEIPGKIVTRDGKDDIRVVCWDAKRKYPIVVLLTASEGEEIVITYTNEGNRYHDGDISPLDIFLEVPEWTQCKEGDVIACEIHEGPNDYCKWFAILKDKIERDNKIYFFGSHASYCYDASAYDEKIGYDEFDRNIISIRLATEEEKQMFIKRLKKENTDKAKGILKQFFGVEEKPKCEFEPFQKVLVRDSDDEIWTANFFSHYDNDHAYKYVICGNYSFRICIPYNENTKHLLGTTDNWEEE